MASYKMASENTTTLKMPFKNILAIFLTVTKKIYRKRGDFKIFSFLINDKCVIKNRIPLARESEMHVRKTCELDYSVLCATNKRPLLFQLQDVLKIVYQAIFSITGLSGD